MSRPNCKDTGWVEIPGISGIDDPATTLQTCDCEVGAEVRAAQADAYRKARDAERAYVDLVFALADEARGKYLLIALSRSARSWMRNFTDQSSEWHGAALVVDVDKLAGILNGARDLGFVIFDGADNEGGG